MIHSVTHPVDPLLFEFPMVRFKFITDDYSLSFVVKDKFSEGKLREALKELSSQELDSIIQVVVKELEEENVGETEFSEITSVVTIRRILSSED
jgi:hypothetical protein